jgi:hypothetical protein
LPGSPTSQAPGERRLFELVLSFFFFQTCAESWCCFYFFVLLFL